ncbi:MAG: MotA/TolQ/ExbB proton channel family protein [Planctomycetaceae bacterium]|nr:MotA/TolQ/ExbB proton channel family protein [Planctomycetaceae bacterium]
MNTTHDIKHSGTQRMRGLDCMLRLPAMVAVAIALAASAAQALSAQTTDAAASAPAQSAPPTFDAAAQDIAAKLEASLAELSAFRAQTAEEKIPLMREIGDLEQALVKARQKYQATTNLLATRSLDLTKITAEIKSREEEVAYLSNLLGEYLRNFESGLHITELQRMRKDLEATRDATENDELPAKQRFDAQARMLAASIERLHEAFNGTRFDGSAVDTTGSVLPGTFVLAGPAALFRSADGNVVGTVEQRLGSLEPNVTVFESPELRAAASTYIASGTGGLPFDPTLGNAHRIAETEETLWEHIKAGGPVMWPIGILAGAAFLVALFKWVMMLFVRMPSERRVREVLRAIGAGDRAKAAALTAKLPGPLGRMLETGVSTMDSGREIMEESMYEVMHRTQLKVQSMLPFVAISAAAAPLLGLLGTVTGIMNTFSLITIYGTGDVKTLSSGISEALITTEYGLIVAIPSLLLHAYLSSKARKITNRMETTGISFVNEIARRDAKPAAATSTSAPVPVGAA